MAVIINGTTGIDTIQDGVVTSDKLANTIDFDGKKIIIPTGTTAERPVSPTVGELRLNTDTNVVESWNGLAWRNAYDPLPEITSVSPTDFNGESGTTITVNGNFFTNSTEIYYKTTGGSYQAVTSTFVNSNQMTFATLSDHPTTDSPLSVKVINSVGEDESLNAITLGQSPTWVTSAGALTAGNSGVAYNQSVSATDSDGTVTYSLTSGSLPTGLSLNTSTGSITGTPTSTLDENPTFGITATDNAGNSAGERSFSIYITGTQYQVEYIVVAGGAGGGGANVNDASGAGGAGGYRTSTLNINKSSSFTVTVGGGGAGAPSRENYGGDGGNSVFGSITSIGGGGGGGSGASGRSGGSGGGGGRGAVGGAGTSGQGNNGGTGFSSGSFPPRAGGGGGGANSVGGTASNNTAGNGGAGKSDTWTGSTRTLAGGGGGFNNGGGNGGYGGAGGGGNGQYSQAGNNTPQSGSTNTGGGGGAGVNVQSPAGAPGGSGIVIIRYAGSQIGSGGTVTSSGGYTLHTFTSSGTYNS